jgi:GxxExxY protein
MPISTRDPIACTSQKEFSEIAYRVMGVVFEVHRDLGRLFDERIYQREIAERLPNARLESPIDVTFDSFAKTYLVDLLVENKAIFELKAAEAIAPRHRAQLLHYLLLANVNHGKLINMRPDWVEHEFLNTTLTHADRTCFSIEDRDWDEGVVPGLKEWIVSFLRDIGVGLDLSLYEEAAVHYCAPNSSITRLDIRNRMGRIIGTQEFHLLAADLALRVSALSSDNLVEFEQHLRRFLEHTSLCSIAWINLTRSHVHLRTLS